MVFCGDLRWFSVFFGQYRYNLDAKGRIVIPQEFRKQMGTNCVVSAGLEECITIYTYDDWQKYVEKSIDGLDDFDEQAREFKRLLFSSAFPKDIDYQGRVTLDKSLIDYANITKDVVILGTINCIEIWAAEKYSERFQERSTKAIALGNLIAERKRNSNAK